MDYGSILFANAPKSTLTLLDRIQNHSIRLAIGATKTTLIPALEFQTKTPLLHLRRMQLIQQHVLRSLSNTDTSTLDHYLTIHDTWRFRRATPLISQVTKYLKGTFHLIQIDKYPYKALPYMEIFYDWHSKFLKFCNNLLATQEFLNLINSDPQYHHDHSIHIYPDVSKTNSQCTAAFHIAQRNALCRQFILHRPTTSIYSAELLTIYLALRHF